MKQNIFSAEKARRAAGDHHAFIETWTGFGNGRRRQIHINVIGDEKIEFAVAVVVDESTAGVPTLAIGRDASFFANVGERSIAVVVVEDIFAEIGNEEIFVAIIVVIANATTLSPA